MKQGIIALIVGMLFGLGLTLSGMTQPQKVISFLDFFGDWDPSLAFVMAGAIMVHFIAYRFQKKIKSPFFDYKFYLPEKKDIDLKLVFGAVLFGIGWGLAGYCPGPALVSLVTLNYNVLLFVFAMTIGIFFHDNFFVALLTKKKSK